MLFHLFLLFGSSAAVIVNTKYGKVKGYPFISRNYRQVWSFSGIRYATPPVGHLRFKDPVPPKPYDGVRDVKYTTPCIPNFNITNINLIDVKPDEDCLQVTVYTPLNSTKPYPVMVWFHGGAFIFGAGQSMYGAEYFMDYDMVMVEAECRLGLLGLLTLENNIMPGNMQLKDQVLALKWVQENIAAFGGDPNKVTLMGHSAGSVAVNYHMKSPMSRGLFHAAISESGEATAPWALAPPGYSRVLAKTYAAQVNCYSIDDYRILRCLQRKNVSDLFKHSIFPAQLPVIDSYSPNPFIPVNPQQSESAPVPYFVGVANLDGFVISEVFEDPWLKNVALNYLSQSFGIPYVPMNKILVNHKTIYAALDLQFDVIAPLLLLYYYPGNYLGVSQRIRHFYFDNKPITRKSFGNLTNLFSDRYFFWPLLESLNLHPGPAYVYNVGCNNSNTEKYGLTGSTHNDTPVFLWKVAYGELDENCRKFSEQAVKICVDFATYGTPTPPGSSDFQWPLWNKETQPFMTIDSGGNFREDHGFYPERMQFWKKLHNFAPDIDKY